MDRYFSGAVLVTVFLAAVVVYTPSDPEPDLQGYTQVENVDAAGNALLLETSCYRLTMVVSQSQSDSILRGLSNFTAERPLTHDLFAATLSKLGAELEAVKVYGLANGTYRAYLVLDDGEKTLVDARPSDATALAARTGTPIYVKDKLLREEGIDKCGRGGEIV